MAVNALTYVKNVGKSFGYSSIELLKSYNPQITALAEGAKELTESLYDTIDSFKAKMYGDDEEKGFLGKGKDYVSEIRDNLFEDLKTGTWYNKQRDEKQQEDLAMQMYGIDEEDFNLDDLDFDFDDDMDFDDIDSTETIIESEKENTKSVINAMDVVAGKAAGAIAESNVRSADYVAASQRQSSKALYSLSARGFQQMSSGFAALNSNIQQLVTLGEPLTTHMQNSATFYTESSEFHKNLMTKIDKLIELNAVDTNNSRYNYSRKGLNYILSDGVIDLGAYFDFLSDNVKEFTEDIKGMLDMIGGFDGLVKMMSGSPLKMIVDSMTKVAFPKMIKGTMKSFNEHLEGFFAAAIDKLQYGQHKGLLGDIISNFGDKLFPSDKYKKKVDTSNYNKGKTFWDGKSKKALEEVIPTYLSAIASAVTGAPETRYNYNNGKFETVAGIKRAYDETKARYAKSAGGDFRTDSIKLIDNLDLSSEAKDKMRQEIENFFLKSFEEGKSKMTEINKDDFDASKFGLSHDSLAILRAILGSYARTGKTDKANRFAGETRLQRDSYGDYIRSLESSNGDPVLSLFDNSSVITKGANPEKNRDVKKEDLIKPGGILGIDNYNHDIFYYLQGIYKHTKHVSDNLGFIGGGSGGSTASSSSNGLIPIADIQVGTTPSINTEISNNNSLSYITSSDSQQVISSREQLDDLIIKNHEWEDESGPLNRRKQQEKRRREREERIESKRRDLRAGSITEDEFREFLESEDKKIERENRSADNVNSILNRFSDIANDSDTGKGIRSVYSRIQDIVNKPAEIIAEILGAGEISMYHLIYGSEGDDEKGLFAYFFDKADTLFTKFQNFLQTKWWDSAKDWMNNNLNSGEGFWNATKRELKAAWKHETESAARFLGLESAPREQSDSAQRAIDRHNRRHEDNGEGSTEQAPQSEVQQAISNLADNIQNNAFGNLGSRRGLAAVSEGEIIVPANENPLFFGNYADGGIIDLDNYDDDTRAMIEDLRSKGASDNLILKKIRYSRARQTGFEDELSDFERRVLRNNSSQRENRDRAISRAKSARNVKDVVQGSMAQLTNGIQDVFNHIIPQDSNTENNIIDKFINEENARRLKEANIPKEAINNKGALGAGAIIGAGASILTGCIVGPLAGAAIGAGVGLVVKSERVQKALFGEVGEDGKRTGGILNKKVSEFITKKAPSIAKAGGLGAVAGLFMGSPVLGTIMGSAIGFASQSDKFKNYLFGSVGEDGSRQGGLISKKVQDAIKDRLPKIGAGAIAGLVLGPFGSIPANLIIGGSLGFLSSTETFKKILLGDPDSNDPRKKDGILGGLKNYLFGKVTDDNKKQGLLVSITGIFEKLAIDVRLRTKEVFHNLNKIFRHMAAKAVHSTIGQKIANSKLVKAGKVAVGAATGVALAPWKAVRYSAQRLDEHLGRRALDKGEGLYNREEHRMMTAQERIAERTRLGMDEHAASTLRAQSNRNFDNFLANNIQDEEQLNKVRRLLSIYNDPTKIWDEDEIKIKREFARQLEDMHVDPREALKLERALAGKGFKNFEDILKGTNLSDEQRSTLQNQFDKIKGVREERDKAVADKRYARDVLRQRSDTAGLFDELEGLDIRNRSDTDIQRMLELINAEEEGRFKRTDEQKKADAAEDRDKKRTDDIDEIHKLLQEVVDLMQGKNITRDETNEESSNPDDSVNNAADAIRDAADSIREATESVQNATDNLEDQIDDSNEGSDNKKGIFSRVRDIAHEASNKLRTGKANLGMYVGEKVNSVLDRFRGNRNHGEGSTEPIEYNGNAAKGRKVTKTGIVAVSEGELIIPSDFNPYYHGTNDKRTQLANENKAVDKFFGNYAFGGTIKSGLNKIGNVGKTIYDRTAGAREVVNSMSNKIDRGLNKAVDKVKSGGNKLYEAWKNRDSGESSEESSNTNSAAEIVRNNTVSNNASMQSVIGNGVEDDGLNDDRSDVVTQTDAFGNVYQLRKNNQGELTMDETDSQTQSAMRSQRNLKDALMNIPIIGDKIDQLRESIVGNGDKSTKKKGKTVMDVLKGLTSGIIGKGGLLGGIFHFLTATKIGTKVKAVLAGAKNGLAGVLTASLLGGGLYAALDGKFDDIISKITEAITGGGKDQYGDSTRKTINGKTLAVNEHGQLIKNDKGEFQTEDGEWISGDINIIGEDNSLSHNLKKNAIRGFVGNKSSVASKAIAKSVNNIKKVITGQEGTLTGKDLSGKGLANTLSDAGAGFLNSIQSSLRSLLSKMPSILHNIPFIGKKYFGDTTKTAKACDELFDLIYHKIKGAKKTIAKFASGFAKCLAILNVVQIVTAASNAWGDAESILGVSDPTTGQRLIAVLVATINTMIPFIGDIIPNDVLVDIFVKIAPLLGIDLSDFEQQRSDAERELEEYNKENGTDLDWDEYLMEQGRRGWWSKTKHKFNNLKENIKEKGIMGIAKEKAEGIKNKFTSFAKDVNNNGVTNAVDDAISNIIPGPVGDVAGNISRIWTNAFKGDTKAVLETNIVDMQGSENNLIANIANKGIGTVLKIPAIPVSVLAIGVNALLKPIEKMISGIKNSITFVKTVNEQSDTLYRYLKTGDLNWKDYFGSVNNYKDPDGNPISGVAKSVAFTIRLLQFPKFMIKSISGKIASSVNGVINTVVNNVRAVYQNHDTIKRLAWEGDPVGLWNYSAYDNQNEDSPVNGFVNAALFGSKLTMTIPSIIMWTGRKVKEKVDQSKDTIHNSIRSISQNHDTIKRLAWEGDPVGLWNYSPEDTGEEKSPLDGFVNAALFGSKLTMTIPSIIMWTGRGIFSIVKPKFEAIRNDFTSTEESIHRMAGLASQGDIKGMWKDNIELNKEDDPIHGIFSVVHGISKVILTIIGAVGGVGMMVGNKFNSLKKSLGDKWTAVKKFFGVKDEEIQETVVEHSKKYSADDGTPSKAEVQDALSGNIDYGGGSSLRSKIRETDGHFDSYTPKKNNIIPFYRTTTFDDNTDYDEGNVRNSIKQINMSHTSNNNVYHGGGSGLKNRFRGLVGGSSDVFDDTISNLSTIENVLRSLLYRIPNVLRSIPFIGSKYFSDTSRLTKACDELFSLIYHKIKNAKKLTKKLAAKFSKCIAVFNIIQTVATASNAWGDAESILGISDPTVGQRLIAVLVATINNMIPFIGDIISNDELVDIFVKVAPLLGIDISGFEQQRENAKKELEKYNKDNETDLDWDQYLMKQGKRGWLSKVGNKFDDLKSTASDKIKEIAGKVKNSIGGSSNLFVSQKDKKYRDIPFGGSNIGDVGCAPAAATMLMNYERPGSMTMDKAIRAAKNYQHPDGTSADYFGSILNQNGLSSNYIDSTTKRGKQSIVDDLASGKPAVLLGQDATNDSKDKSPFGPNKHFVMATGFDEFGNVIVNDPESNSPNKLYNPSILNKVDMAVTSNQMDLDENTDDIIENTNPIGGASTVPDNEITKASYGFLTKNGYSPASSAGILANAAAESGVNPAIIQSNGKGPAAGMFQWENWKSKSGRWLALNNYAASKGKDWTDLNSQLEFFDQEMHSADIVNRLSKNTRKPKGEPEYVAKPLPNGIDDFKKLDDPLEAALQFETAFERAGKPNMPRRFENAKQYYNMYSGSEYTGNYVPGKVGSVTGGNKIDDTSQNIVDNGTTPLGQNSGSDSSSGVSDILGSISSAFQKGFQLIFGGAETQSSGEYCNSSLDGSCGINNGFSGSSDFPNSGDGEGTAQNFIDIARSQLGTVEKPDNITPYGEFMKANGQPWCASFVSWAMDKTFDGNKEIRNKALRGNPSASVQGLWNNFKSANAMYDKPQPGDIVIYKNSGASHTGLVESVEGNKAHTIEGNTSGDNKYNRNGGMVARKIIEVGKNKRVTGFGRPDWSTAAEMFKKLEKQQNAEKAANSALDITSSLKDAINNPNKVNNTSNGMKAASKLVSGVSDTYSKTKAANAISNIGSVAKSVGGRSGINKKTINPTMIKNSIGAGSSAPENLPNRPSSSLSSSDSQLLELAKDAVKLLTTIVTNTNIIGNIDNTLTNNYNNNSGSSTTEKVSNITNINAVQSSNKMDISNDPALRDLMATLSAIATG